MKHLTPFGAGIVAALTMLTAAPAMANPAVTDDLTPEMQRALDACNAVMDKADLGLVWAKMPGPEGTAVMDPPPAMRDDPSLASGPEQAAIGRLLKAREECDRVVHPAMPSVPDYLKRLTSTENALLLRLQQGKMSWGEFNRTRGAAWTHAARAAERQP